MTVPVMGVDPGVNGGVAVLGANGLAIFVRGFDDEMAEEEVVVIMREAVNHLRAMQGTRCYFEKVHHMTGDGGKGSHTFGYIKGLLRGLIKAYGIDIRDVPPQLWQTRFDCLSGGNKNVTKCRAIELFPEIKVTHKVADALLIALYGHMLEEIEPRRS